MHQCRLLQIGPWRLYYTHGALEVAFQKWWEKEWDERNLQQRINWRELHFLAKAFFTPHVSRLPKGVHVTATAKVTVIAKGGTRRCGVSELPKGTEAIVQRYCWRGIPGFSTRIIFVSIIFLLQMAEGAVEKEPKCSGWPQNPPLSKSLLLCKVLNLMVHVAFPSLSIVSTCSNK